MGYPYTVNDLLSIFKISKTTFYSQVKKNQDFFAANSIKVRDEGKKSKSYFKYNQSVFDFFASQYGKGKNETESEALGNTAPQEDASTPILEKNGQEDALSAKAPETPTEAPEGESQYKDTINALQAKIDALEAKLEAAEAERRELVAQNGNLLLLLSQEKQEKQLLLPAPKKTIGERIKSLFRK